MLKTQRSPIYRTSVLLLVVLECFTSGCGRSFYRQQADCEVYALVDSKAGHPHWPLEDYTIAPDPRSRYFDPFDPDCPPMPPDDPESHKLMHCIDGMCGDGCWHCNGDTPFTQNPAWQAYLPRNERGEVPLDRAMAVQLGLTHAREYQNELEDLYLSALDVTFERFRFDAQFSLGTSTFLTADARNRAVAGGQSSTTLQTNTGLGVSRLFANGGELMVGFANSLVWQFSGPDSNGVNSLLDFSLVQPLLRGGGRAVVLERLTLTERTLLANIRQMERYRRGFYARVVTGRDPGQGPQRRGGITGAGLSGFTGLGTGFGGLAGNAGGGGNQTGVAGGAGAGTAGGFMGLLQVQQQIENREANVASLRDSLAQLEAAYEAGRIDRFQVELAQQALYNAESQLLTAKAQFEAQFDNFKLVLGLPPQTKMTLADRTLARFELIDPIIPPLQNRLADLQEQAGGIIVELAGGLNGDAQPQNGNLDGRIGQLSAALQAAAAVHRDALAHFTEVELDLAALEDNIDDRRRTMIALAQKEQAAERQPDATGSSEQPTETDSEVVNRPEIRRLATLPEQLRRDLAALRTQFARTPEEIKRLQAELRWIRENRGADDAAMQARMVTTFGDISDRFSTLSSDVLELSLIQARARAESIVLEPINLESDKAIEIARRFRRDWMNARASLVDVWRLIEFNANDLLSDLSIIFSGDVGTSGDNPIRLDRTTGRLRAGVQFDSPVNRVAERNNYRQALIEFQRAKRDYYTFEDRVAQSLRNTIRSIDLDQLNFELRRAAIRVAIDQVELARLRLREPPRPGEATVVNTNLARDLVSALSDLLNVQNDFLSVWVDYEVERINLDFDLGTMQLDQYGMWIDPGGDIGNVEKLGLTPCTDDLGPYPGDPLEGVPLVPGPGASTDVEARISDEPADEELPPPAVLEGGGQEPQIIFPAAHVAPTAPAGNLIQRAHGLGTPAPQLPDGAQPSGSAAARPTTRLRMPQQR